MDLQQHAKWSLAGRLLSPGAIRNGGMMDVSSLGDEFFLSDQKLPFN
jgi:hypothetical protein